jgi:tripartite-type tricarboxylate transporter receptor subunit TctC
MADTDEGESAGMHKMKHEGKVNPRDLRTGAVRAGQCAVAVGLIAAATVATWPEGAAAQSVQSPQSVLQDLRSRPIRLVVAAAAGGGSDITARHVARTMGEQMRHSVLVENRPGAGSATGTEYAAKATPDGHTLLVSTGSSMVMNGFLYKNLPYDALRDFAAVGFIAAYPFVLIARNDLPANNLAEFMKFARERPGKLNYGSAGVGTLQHVWGTILLKGMGLDLLHVPYKGAAMATQEMIGGRIEVMFDNLSAARGPIAAGRVKALAVSSAQRAPQLPNVPTVNESGVARFDGESWMGMFAPAATPPAVVNTLRSLFQDVVRDAQFVARIEAAGGRVMNIPPQQQQAFLRSESERWGRLIRQYEVTAQ